MALAVCQRVQELEERDPARVEQLLDESAGGCRGREAASTPATGTGALDPTGVDEALHEANGPRLGQPQRPAKLLDRAVRMGSDRDESARCRAPA